MSPQHLKEMIASAKPRRHYIDKDGVYRFADPPNLDKHRLLGIRIARLLRRINKRLLELRKS